MMSTKLEGTIATLYKAIKEHSSLEDSSIADAGRHGASGGFGGFCYYTETVAFYDKNEEAIWELLYQQAESYNSILQFIADFDGAEHVGSGDQFKNLLAWFALEEVGRALEDSEEEE
jgi:hypothetical protein